MDTPTASDTPTETATATLNILPTDTATPSVTATVTETPTLSMDSSLLAPEVLTAGVFTQASFLYDGDGHRVQSVLTTDQGPSTTYFVGNYYELTGSVVTKYYYAGSRRIAMRVGGAVSFLMVDHLGSTSLSTDASGAVTSQQWYTAWGEVRYATGSLPTDYTYKADTHRRVASGGM